MDTVIFDSPVIGFRFWRTDNNGNLFSTMSFPMERDSVDRIKNFRTIKWNDDTDTIAECYSYFPHKECPPKIECSCGIHAYKLPEKMLAEYILFVNRYKKFDFVAGAILCSGTVVEHERGMRAEKGRPIAFVDSRSLINVPHENIENIKMSASVFGVPVLDHREIEQYSQEYGVML